MLNFISFPKGPAVSARVAAQRSCFPFPNRVNKDAASWQGGKGLREETSTQQHPPESHLMHAAWSATTLHMLQARLTSSHQAHLAKAAFSAFASAFGCSLVTSSCYIRLRGMTAALLPACSLHCWFYSFWSKLLTPRKDQPVPVPSLNQHLAAQPRPAFDKGLHREVEKK